MGQGYEPAFRVSEPQSMVVALFLRDAFRLPVALNIPALSPAVPHASAPVPFDADAACSEWSRWWDRLLVAEDVRRPGGQPTEQTFPKAAEFPVLAALCADVRREALDYSAQRKREEGPVSILVTQLPVDGDFSWARSPHHLLVSRSTRADSTAYLAALRNALGWNG